MRSVIHAPESGRTYRVGTKMILFTCATCGIPYGLPMDYIERRQEDGQAWYCPNGHSLGYDCTEEDRLRAQLKSSEEARARTAAARDQARASAAAYKGHATRVKKRIANGVCPCCNRSFKDVLRHMRSQHPGFDPTGEDRP